MTRDIKTIYLSSADDPIANIYHLLDLARDRPGMYGIGGRSYRLLHAFLGSLAYANLNPGDPPFSDFDWWATVHTDHVGTSMPWRWLEIEQPDDPRHLDGRSKNGTLCTPNATVHPARAIRAIGCLFRRATLRRPRRKADPRLSAKCGKSDSGSSTSLAGRSRGVELPHS